MMKSALEDNSRESLGVALKDAEVHQNLLKRLVLALRIGKRTIQYLGADGFSGADLPEGNFAAEKPLAETAMLLYLASRERSDPGVREGFNGLVQDLIPYARSKLMGLDILRYPSVCLQMATPHILLELLGSTDSQFDDLLHRAVELILYPPHQPPMAPHHHQAGGRTLYFSPEDRRLRHYESPAK